MMILLKIMIMRILFWRLMTMMIIAKYYDDAFDIFALKVFRDDDVVDRTAGWYWRHDKANVLVMLMTIFTWQSQNLSKGVSAYTDIIWSQNIWLWQLHILSIIFTAGRHNQFSTVRLATILWQLEKILSECTESHVWQYIFGKERSYAHLKVLGPSGPSKLLTLSFVSSALMSCGP